MHIPHSIVIIYLLLTLLYRIVVIIYFLVVVCIMLPSKFAYHQRPNSLNFSVNKFINTQDNQRHNICIRIAIIETPIIILLQMVPYQSPIKFKTPNLPSNFQNIFKQ